MNKFSFPLQKLLTVKKHTEDQKAIALGKAMALLNKEKYQLNLLQETKKALFDGADYLSGNLQSMRSSNEYLLQINRQIEEQKEKINLAEKQVQEKRAQLVKANQDKKSVELLKESQLQAFKKEVNRTNQIKEDEVASRVMQNNRI